MKKKKRFADVSEEQKKKIMEERQSLNTKKSTDKNMRLLKTYLLEKNKPEIEEITDAELLEFYAALRTKNSDHFKINILKNIRSGINRYMKESRGVDIVADPAFTRANEMFKGVKVQSKKAGKGTMTSKFVIKDEDLQKIRNYLDHDQMNNPSPKKLQQAVIFFIVFYFCRRGRENLYGMKKNMFTVAFDQEQQLLYVEQNVDEMDKNHSENDPNIANEGRMYEMPGM